MRDAPAGSPEGGGSGALLDLEDGLRLEAVGLAMDLDRGVTVRRLDQAEHLAGLLVDPVVLVVDPVRALDADVLGMCARDGFRLDAGEVVDVEIGRHRKHAPSRYVDVSSR